jgi:hypothetical protein
MSTSTLHFRVLLHAVNIRQWTDVFTSSPKDFFALKNPTVSAEFEPANLGAKGQHSTPRPPKPYNLLSESFLILSRIERGIIINIHKSSSEVPVILFRF